MDMVKEILLHKLKSNIQILLIAEQRELLEKLQMSFGIESKPHEDIFEGMFTKVKSWFK